MHKIFGTYCATLTPFNSDYSINKKLLLEHCNNLLSQNIDGIAIFGTTGEANSLSITENTTVFVFYPLETNITVYFNYQKDVDSCPKIVFQKIVFRKIVFREIVFINCDKLRKNIF